MITTASVSPTSHCPVCGYNRQFDQDSPEHPWICPFCFDAQRPVGLIVDGHRLADLRGLDLPSGCWDLPVPPITEAKTEAEAVHCCDCANAIRPPKSPDTGLVLCKVIRGGRWLHRRHACQLFEFARVSQEARP